MTTTPRRFLARLRPSPSSADQEAEATEQANRESRELRARITAQWAEIRAARRALEAQPQPGIGDGSSNFRRARVPYGVDLAAAWGWRFLVISASLALILYVLNFFLVIVLPIVIALFIAALVSPVVKYLGRALPHKVAALLTVVLLITFLAALITFVSTQIANGASDLSKQAGDGVMQIRDWLQNGPLHASDSQISDALSSAQDKLKSFGTAAVGRLSAIGATLGDVVAGLFIVLFSTFFFLADGQLIWAWIVRLFPRAARKRADSSGRVAWASLTQFVRATVMVAAVDAVGIMIGAAVLQVPFVGAIGVLIFLGAFVPLVGAAVTGIIAVLVALVAHGPVVALIMAGVVVGVQQLEAHILQPFLMGRFVSVHPLGVIVAIGLGVLVAGVPGALVAVPLTASLNAVVQHLAADVAVGEGVETETDEGVVGDTEQAPDE